MWVVYALLSALFAGITAILAKIGIRNTDSHLATALRTVVVLAFAWVMVFVVGSQGEIAELGGKTVLFLMLSGLTTGASWLCYFKALQLGNVNKVAPIDKSSTVLTMLLAFFFLGEGMTWLKVISMVLMAVGAWLMIQKKEDGGEEKRGWLIYALFSALFASLTTILGKVGISGVESNLGTAIRTVFVLIMAWVLVFVLHKQTEIRHIDRKSWIFIGLSGIATGLSWLCYYRALQEGDAGIVAPIDKLSIVVTVAFSWIFLKEKLSGRAAVGLIGIVGGTMLLLL